MDTSGRLATEIRKRLDQMGMSRRELSRRISISRQTLHELEHNPTKGFAETTFQALDEGLKWPPGTARAFHMGEPLSNGTSTQERIERYLNDILQRLAAMDVGQLEREVLMLEEEHFGPIKTRNVETSKLIGDQISCLVASLLSLKNGANERDDASNGG